MERVQASVEFLRELLDIARELLVTEHIEDSAGLEQYQSPA